MMMRSVLLALCCAIVVGCDGGTSAELVMGDFGTLSLSPAVVGTTFEATLTAGGIGEGSGGPGSILGNRTWRDPEREINIAFIGPSFAEAEVFEMDLFIDGNLWIWSPQTNLRGSLDLDLEGRTLTFTNLTLTPANSTTPITLDGTLTW